MAVSESKAAAGDKFVSIPAPFLPLCLISESKAAGASGGKFDSIPDPFLPLCLMVPLA